MINHQVLLQFLASLCFGHKSMGKNLTVQHTQIQLVRDISIQNTHTHTHTEHTTI